MGRTALLLIDMVNPMEFDSADDLFAEAMPAAERIASFASRARAAGIPVIYANDNFGSWHVGFRELVDRVRTQSARGAILVEMLCPDPTTDHFVQSASPAGARSVS
jgi:nicotinamidase-related amidase